MRESVDFFMSICQEGIVLSKGDQIWFFRFEDLKSIENVEDFLEAIGC